MSRELKKQICMRMLAKGNIFEVEVAVLEGIFSERLVKECKVELALNSMSENK